MADTIALMKQRVLDMAIRGELVEQREEEGFSVSLLAQIEDKKNKKPKSSKIDDFEKPFTLPNSWTWVQLNKIGEIIGGGTPKTSINEYWEDGNIPWISPADLTGYKEKLISHGRKSITEIGLSKSSAKLMPKGTVIFSSRAPIGYVAIAANEISTNQGFKSVVPYIGEMNEYIYYYFQGFIENIKDRSSGTTFKEISGSELGKSAFPLPPLAEQKRIVAKIEKIFAVIDQIGTKKEEALSIIRNMRQTALKDAIMGVLVEQDENDEPSSILYEKIQAEKERLVKEKKIKKDKPLPDIEEDEIPFEIPKSWKWVRLSDIGSIIGGGTPKTSVDAYWEGGTIPWVSPADLTGYKERTISEGRRNITELGLSKSSARLMPAGTVLFSSRAPIGYVAIAENPISTNQGFKSVVPYIMDMNHYIYYYFFAFIDDIKSRSSGTTFKEISGSELGKSFFPMPPLAEQQRIVEKLDEIMAICDQMEAIFDGTSEMKMNLNAV